jgi:glucokinase
LVVNQDSFPRLLGDIGGTNARFAIQTHALAVPSHEACFACADFASLEVAVKHYLSTHKPIKPLYCALGIANPILGDHVQMTNHHWSFSISQMQNTLGFQRLIVLNDFTALALSLPLLSKDHLQQVGTGNSVAGAPVALIGPGTGLGVSGLLTSGSTTQAIGGEGGHVTLSACDEFEFAIIQNLQKRFGHASAERALSGPGLVNLYRAVCELKKVASVAILDLEPFQIVELAKEKSNPQCAQALELFFSFLGSVAGNLALTLGARGGVYLGGGILPKLLDELQASAFRQRFESKGRFQNYLRTIPTFVIDSPISPALIGASVALDER